MFKPLSLPLHFLKNPYIILLVATAMWGTSTLFSRMAVGEISPMWLIFIRWLGTCLITWPLIAKDLPTYWPELRPQFLKLCLMGMLGFTAFNACMYIAAHHTTAINISIIVAAQPIIILMGASLVFRTPINLYQILGILITLLGVAAIASKGNLETLQKMNFNFGDLFMLLGLVFYALYALGLRNKPAVPGMVLLGVLSAMALVTSLPLVVYEVIEGNFFWPTIKGWSVAAGIILFPSFLAHICFIRSVSMIGPERAAPFFNLVPFFGTAFAVVLLREQLSLIQICGLALILPGVWLAERFTSSKNRD
ncbi:DMT family transporter [Microvirga sp. W0021]|uniref:DMT family transporter n=1 Tax=Hohaiivirga grylli TaxID=3133970 RepID=A0ABV0BJY0_9HYPH